MDLSERVVNSAFDNYGLNYNMNECEMISTVSKVIYNHFINKGEGMFQSRKQTKLVMLNESFKCDVLAEIKFRK